MPLRAGVLVIAALASVAAGCDTRSPSEVEELGIERQSVSSPADNVTLTTASQVEVRRQHLINFVWGQATLPTITASVEPVTAICANSGLPNLSSTTQLRVDMTNNQQAWVCHLSAAQSNGGLVVLHQGHGCGMSDGTDPFYDDNGGGMQRMAHHLLNEGFGVLYVNMPRYRPGDCPSGIDPHLNILGLTPPQGSSIQYFLTGTLAALNFVQGSYQEVHMIGLSGGGWATAWYAALDTRVKMSFVVSGAMPFEFWPSNTAVDEQRHAPYYQSTGYKDLFLMGAHGLGRRQISVLRRQDTCCFSPSWNLSNGQSWANNVHSYESEIRTALVNMGSQGMYRLEIDDSSQPAHTISRNAVTNLILAELQGARRHIGAADASDAFARGANGNLWRRTSTSTTWSDTGLAVVGVPSVIKVGGALNLFFRNRENQLIRATLTGVGWTSAALGGSIISDPAAVSRDGSTWDVIGFGGDYKLYAWSSDSVGGALVSSTAMGLGTPSLVSNASNPNELYSFFRGLGNGVYAVVSNGSGWSIDTSLQPGAIRGFPTGAQTTAGIRRVYAYGTTGQLFENLKGAGGWSGWSSVSAAAGVTNVFLVGSPSTALTSNGVSVRTAIGNLGHFAVAGSAWSFSNRGGGMVGSPTRVPSGSWARAPDNSLWFNGTAWSSFGGWLE